MAYLNPLSVKRTAIRTKQLGNERGGGGGGGGKERRVEGDLLRICMGITGHKNGSLLKKCVKGTEHSSH